MKSVISPWPPRSNCCACWTSANTFPWARTWPRPPMPGLFLPPIKTSPIYLNIRTFRKDLFFRLQTHHIQIPPLRERLDDLPLLLDSFISSAAAEFQKETPVFEAELTDKDGLIENNRITRLGAPLSALPSGRHALALILLAKPHEISECARRNLNKHVLACNQLGGVMARMTSGRSWLRFSQAALTNGVTLNAVGSHILRQLHADPDRYESAEMMVVVGNRNHVERWRPVAEKQAQARSDRYQSALVEKMACETGLDCDQRPGTARPARFYANRNWSWHWVRKGPWRPLDLRRLAPCRPDTATISTTWTPSTWWRPTHWRPTSAPRTNWHWGTC